MRAVVFKELGQEKVLHICDIPIGKPNKGEVLIKLTSIGLNRADLLFPQGRYFSKPVFLSPPRAQNESSDNSGISRLGFEGAGEIVAVGNNVQRKVGDRVAFINFDQVSEKGCLAEYAIIAEDKLLPTPTSVNDELAGAIWIQYLTAWGGLIADGDLRKGQTVVVTAASSSVGLASIQIAKSRQAKVIATTTSNDKFEGLYRAGADLVINMDKVDYVEEIYNFTNDRGTDLVFDAVAGPAIRHLIQGSGNRGKIIIQGLLDRRPMDIHAGVLMKRQLTIKGFVIGKVLESSDLLRQATSTIGKGLNQGYLNPVIAGVYGMDAFRSAFAMLKSGRHLGKIVISPQA